jgi:nucleoside-diphosphate-sugar epimerase
MSFPLQKTLVTSGADFIGSHCVEALLARGSEIVVFDDFNEAVEKKAYIRQRPEQPGNMPRAYTHVDKARRLLGYGLCTSIRDGVRKYAECFIENQCQK